MQIEPRPAGERLIVKPLAARIDAHLSLEFKEQMVGLIEAGHRRLILDLSAVEFVDSSGLGAIVAVLKSLGQEGELAVSGVRATVASMFRLTRMDKVFEIHSTLEDALGATSG